jgi:hypothetical protein
MPHQAFQEEQREQHNRVQCRKSIVGTVQMPDALADELEVHRRIDLPHQMVVGSPQPDRDKLHLLLRHLCFYQYEL